MISHLDSWITTSATNQLSGDTNSNPNYQLSTATVYRQNVFKQWPNLTLYRHQPSGGAARVFDTGIGNDSDTITLRSSFSIRR
jgi:hypothetical protein